MEVLEIEILPFQSGKFAAAQTRRHVEKHHGSFPNSQYSEEQVHLWNFENVRCPFTLCRDPNAGTPTGACDRIAIRELPPNRMIENATHRVPDLLSGAACKRLRLPELRCD